MPICKPEEIIFTSGATESNNLVLRGAYDSLNFYGLFCSQIEHPSIFNTINHLNVLNIYNDFWATMFAVTSGKVAIPSLIVVPFVTPHPSNFLVFKR